MNRSTLKRKHLMFTVDPGEGGGTPSSEQEQATPGGEAAEFDPARAQEKIKKANSEAANLRARLKELEPLAAKARELEESGRSEIEKVTQRVADAETRATKAEAESLRLSVAFDKGLTPAQAKRLVGTSREELESDADEILRDFPVKPARPSGDIGQGPRAAGVPLDPRAADLAQIEADLKTSGTRR